MQRQTRPIMERVKLFNQPVRIILVAFLLVFSFQAFGAIETHEFDNDVQRKRYQSFIEEMRCPKCQNQNLAGSDSPISADLRRELYEMIDAGKSDQEIVDFMVARYGDFILYRPRVTPATYALWIAPTALLIAGIIVLIVMLRKRRGLAFTQTTGALNSSEQARLASLLNKRSSDSDNNKKTDNNTETNKNNNSGKQRS